MKRTINIKGTLLDISSPLVMGILNVTPDSFSDGGQFNEMDRALERVDQMVREGATIIDIGGYSSRPGAQEISIQEEVNRVVPVIEKVTSNQDIIISVDTFRSEVALEALKSGASIVNDISAGQDDSNMIPLVSQHQVPFIAMHKQGKPQNMQENPSYNDVVQEVLDYLIMVRDQCFEAGIRDVIVDPGFGFGKTLLHNYAVLSQLDVFHQIEVPIIVGLSRKSMIYKPLGVEPSSAINGSSFLHAHALDKGASILRVHDVKEAIECIKLHELINTP